MVLSALRCYAVEHASLWSRDEEVLALMAGPQDLERLLNHIGAPEELKKDLHYLMEVRHEILHPAHLPTGTPDNLPDYLRPLKTRGLLESSGNPHSDYILMSQLASHRLFTWAIHVAQRVARRILLSDHSKYRSMRGLAWNFRQLRVPEQSEQGFRTNLNTDSGAI